MRNDIEKLVDELQAQTPQSSEANRSRDISSAMAGFDDVQVPEARYSDGRTTARQTPKLVRILNEWRFGLLVGAGGMAVAGLATVFVLVGNTASDDTYDLASGDVSPTEEDLAASALISAAPLDDELSFIGAPSGPEMLAMLGQTRSLGMLSLEEDAQSSQGSTADLSGISIEIAKDSALAIVDGRAGTISFNLVGALSYPVELVLVPTQCPMDVTCMENSMFATRPADDETIVWQDAFICAGDVAGLTSIFTIVATDQLGRRSKAQSITLSCQAEN
jgi:hypothetical protein